MTNEELARAIEVAASHLKGMGTANALYGPMAEHVTELLKEQRRRACAFTWPALHDADDSRAVSSVATVDSHLQRRLRRRPLLTFSKTA